jgi:hypothetical protein
MTLESECQRQAFVPKQQLSGEKLIEGFPKLALTSYNLAGIQM